MKAMQNVNMKRALAAAVVAVCTSFTAQAGNREDVLAQVMALYGLDEQGAINRLAAEEVAADLYRRVQMMNLDEYAGAWFDADSGKLHVAISDSTHAERLAQLGAVPVSANWALRDLKALKSHIREDAFLSQGEQLRALYVDYRLNRLVVSVPPGSVQAVREHLAQYADRIEIEEAGEMPEPTTDVRGADGTRNYNFEESLDFTKEAPCSIGAIVENGFYTAGHCGKAGDDIRWAANFSSQLGVVQTSAYPLTLATQGDIGWVETDPGWTLVPKVNGYSDGIINVPAKWSGTSEYPTYSTVCRYGQTSGGPHCGTVLYPDTDKYFNVLGWMADVTWVQGSCSSDGDSGGTWLSASGSQIQGTTIGRSSRNTCDASPPPSNPETYFQPISDHIAAYSGSAGSLLTSHGAAKATVNGWNCPDPFSAPGSFNCSFDDYESQGVTSFTWYVNNVPVASSGLYIYDVCSPGHLVRVKLTVTNPYGTTTKSTLFNCP